MKKFMVRFIIMLLGLVGVSIVNNVILLRVHPLEFYYTPNGLMMTAIITAIECTILIPAVMWYTRKFLSIATIVEENEKEPN